MLLQLVLDLLLLMRWVNGFLKHIYIIYIYIHYFIEIK